MNSRRGLYVTLFGLFLASGFCGLLYQVVWLRLAFAAFGVITPVLSIVLSVFMLGLSLGSWAGGRWIDALTLRSGRSAAWYYAGAELFIGIGGLLVPSIFSAGQAALLPAGAMDSTRYLFLSALVLGISILPWCILMGFTYPFMMAFIREVDEGNKTGFSYLYLANVIGAMLGTLATAAVLIEILGLHRTSWVAVALNFAIAAVSAKLAGTSPGPRPAAMAEAPAAGGSTERSPLIASILFATGFISLAMEVVWTRAFTPVLRTTIYSFASLLAVYLLATWCGSLLYRRHLARGGTRPISELIAIMSACVFLPILVNDPRFWTSPRPAVITLTLLSIVPFCGCLGYLTPKLIDAFANGRPREAGRAYAINIVGCILGPLFGGYVLLPFLGVKQSMLLLGIPILIYFVLHLSEYARRPAFAAATGLLTIVLFAVAARYSTSYEDRAFYQVGKLRRDHVATVLAAGSGRQKELFVNGISMTSLTPITKIMAHMPLASRDRKPESALVICFGMGTTVRSLSRWDIDITAVELVPSVPDVFDYFFKNAGDVLKNPKVHVVIDDGRRFLRRTEKKFDLITIDPPPPVEASGSSLLYSREFYRLIKTRLKDDGILQTWFPVGEKLTYEAIARAIVDEFPYVRIYHSIENFGYHFSASMQPIEKPGVGDFIARMPEGAREDMLEWADGQSLEAYVGSILEREIPLRDALNPDPRVCVTDDQPYNEYFLLRRTWNKVNGKHASVH
jgi:spermidine synthase